MVEGKAQTDEDIDKLQSDVVDVSDLADGLQQDLSELADEHDTLKDAVEANTEHRQLVTERFSIEPDGVYVRSTADSDTYLHQSSTQMDFSVYGNNTMTIDGPSSTINIHKANVTYLTIGNFKWEAMSDGSLVLKEG